MVTEIWHVINVIFNFHFGLFFVLSINLRNSQKKSEFSKIKKKKKKKKKKKIKTLEVSSFYTCVL